nr:MAG TPA_asm: hypothetical protein [Caudoviricetes sp.]
MTGMAYSPSHGVLSLAPLWLHSLGLTGHLR